MQLHIGSKKGEGNAVFDEFEIVHVVGSVGLQLLLTAALYTDKRHICSPPPYQREGISGIHSVLCPHTIHFLLYLSFCERQTTEDDTVMWNKCQ